MTGYQKWAIAVGTSGLVIVVGTFLPWYSRYGQTISGIGHGGARLFTLFGRIVVLSAIRAVARLEQTSLLARFGFVALFGLMGLLIFAMSMETLRRTGPGHNLTALAILTGGIISVAWHGQPRAKKTR